MTPALSYLYAPGHRPDVLGKALGSAAHVVVADLEDAVPLDQKEQARLNVVAALREGHDKPLHVRVNHVSSEPGMTDLRAVAEAGAKVVRLPKVSSGRDVEVALAVPGPEFHCLLESAAGVERAGAIAAAHARVAAIGLGETDLAADLGATGDAALLYARSRCVVAARAAELPRPVQSVFTDLRDDEGLRRTCREAKALGFLGRSAIHPSQLEPIHESFAPTERDLARARELADALETADGGAMLPDGRFVDSAVVRAARETLALGEAVGPR